MSVVSALNYVLGDTGQAGSWQMSHVPISDIESVEVQIIKRELIDENH